MSKMVASTELRPGVMFEMPNGSVYVTSGDEPTGTLQARLWCAHPPDAVTFDPPRIDIPAEQELLLLSGKEAEQHARHDGYVEAVFRNEMERRNEVMLRSAHERGTVAAAEQRQRDQARLPWWRKLLTKRVGASDIP